MLKIKALTGKWNFRLLRNNRIVFELLHNAPWPSLDATAIYNDETIVIKSKAWRKRYQINKNSEFCGKIYLSSKGKVAIELKKSGSQLLDNFTLKKQGFFKLIYTLFDAQDEPLLIFEPHFNSAYREYDYTVCELHNTCPDEAINELLVYAGFAVYLSASNGSYF